MKFAKRDLARCILAELSSSRSRSCVINLRGQATAGVEAALWRRVCGNAPIEIDRVLVVLRPHGLRGLAQLHGLLPHGLHRALEHGLQVELAVAVVIGLDHQCLRLSSGVASGGHLRVWVIWRARGRSGCELGPAVVGRAAGRTTRFDRILSHGGWSQLWEGESCGHRCWQT